MPHRHAEPVILPGRQPIPERHAVTDRDAAPKDTLLHRRGTPATVPEWVGRFRNRNRLGHVLPLPEEVHKGHQGSPPFVRPRVDAGYLADPALALVVLEVEDLRTRPVEVVRQVRDLLEQPIGRVRHDSPRRPPARSTSNAVPHDGQATPALVCPSLLIRR